MTKSPEVLMLVGAVVWLLPLLPWPARVAPWVQRIGTLGLVVFGVAFAAWLGLGV